MKNNSQSRAWFITINNYTEAEHETALDFPSKYSVVSKEVGDEGTPHIHGYYELERPMRFSTIKKRFPRANIGPRTGTAKEAREYVKKNGDFIERGEPSEQGRRKDIEEVAEKIIKGTDLREIALEHPTTFIKYNRGIREMRNTLLRDRTEKPTVVWLWGKTGVGKTRTPHDIHGAKEVYIKDSTQWWNEYTQQEAIVIDDFDVGRWPYRDLLRLLDRYAYQGQTKGGYVKINSPYIYITCSKAPKDCWMGSELEQIERRVDYTFELN